MLGTTVSNVVLMRAARRACCAAALGGLELARTLRAMAMMVAAAALLGVVAYGVWYGLDSLLGRSLPAQLISVGVALAVGGLAYAAVAAAERAARGAPDRSTCSRAG